jgi:hypothetical protein
MLLQNLTCQDGLGGDSEYGYQNPVRVVTIEVTPPFRISSTYRVHRVPLSRSLPRIAHLRSARSDTCLRTSGRPRIPLEMQRLVVGRLAHTGYAVRASQHNARHPTVYRRPSETLIGLSTVVGASGVYAHEHC